MRCPTWRHPSRFRRSLAAAAIVVAVAGCGSDAPEPSAADRSPEQTGSTESSPFTVGPPPAGYRPTAEGTGTAAGDWGLRGLEDVRPRSRRSVHPTGVDLLDAQGNTITCLGP